MWKYGTYSLAHPCVFVDILRKNEPVTQEYEKTLEKEEIWLRWNLKFEDSKPSRHIVCSKLKSQLHVDEVPQPYPYRTPHIIGYYIKFIL